MEISKNVESQYLNRGNPYYSHDFDLAEFFNRGNVRTRKNVSLCNKEQETIHARDLLKESVQELLQNHFRFQELTTIPTDKPLSFGSKFYNWITGSDRTLKLQHRESCAKLLHDEAESMKGIVKMINQLHAEYIQNATAYVLAAMDAVDHDAATTCGWTWWR